MSNLSTEKVINGKLEPTILTRLSKISDSNMAKYHNHPIHIFTIHYLRNNKRKFYKFKVERGFMYCISNPMWLI